MAKRKDQVGERQHAPVIRWIQNALKLFVWVTMSKCKCFVGAFKICVRATVWQNRLFCESFVLCRLKSVVKITYRTFA